MALSEAVVSRNFSTKQRSFTTGPQFILKLPPHKERMKFTFFLVLSTATATCRFRLSQSRLLAIQSGFSQPNMCEVYMLKKVCERITPEFAGSYPQVVQTCHRWLPRQTVKQILREKLFGCSSKADCPFFLSWSSNALHLLPCLWLLHKNVQTLQIKIAIKKDVTCIYSLILVKVCIISKSVKTVIFSRCSTL